MKWQEWFQATAGALLLMGAIIAFVALAASQYRRVTPGYGAAGRVATPAMPPPAAGRARAVDAPVMAVPLRRRSVYRCVLGGVRTYSETPCGLDSQPTQLDPGALNTYHAPPIAAVSAARHPAVTDASAPSMTSLSAERCRAIEQSMHEVEDALRHPYQEPRGNALRAQLHRLGSEYYELGCGQ